MIPSNNGNDRSLNVWRRTSIPALVATLLLVLQSTALASIKSGFDSRLLTQTKLRNYQYMDSKSIYESLQEFASIYPDLASVTTGQSNPDIPIPGNETECPFDFSTPLGCKTYVLTIQDRTGYPPRSDASSALPDIFLSGALHGDERVGPAVLVEFAALLLEAAHCESFPLVPLPSPGASLLVEDEYQKQLLLSRECREDLTERGVDAYHRRWLARLVATRRIVIVPVANALGYYREEAGEDGSDPAMDFPFDLEWDGNYTCMETVAARTVNDLFEANMFQMALNFNSGASTSVGYAWGSPSFGDSASPDDGAQGQIAAGLVKFAGGGNKGSDLSLGRMNEYESNGVRGNMEDWAYGGKWAENQTRTTIGCQTLSKGKTILTETKENNHRALSFSIGTSTEKKPPGYRLGSNYLALLSYNNALLPRNLRMALMATDLLEPYVAVRAVNDVVLEDDIVPRRTVSYRSCIHTKSMLVPQGKETSIRWTVGGAFNVDNLMVMHAKWSLLPDDIAGTPQPRDFPNNLFDFVQKPQKKGNIRFSYFHDTGTTRWHADGSSPSPRNHPLEPSFSISINMEDYKEGDVIAVFAVARADNAWKTPSPNDNVKPEGLSSPQSLLVNRRTDSTWKKNYRRNKPLIGQEYWFSIPVTLTVTAEGTTTIETSKRLPVESTYQKLEDDIKEVEDEIKHSLLFAKTFLFLTGTMCLVFSAFMYHRKKKKGPDVVNYYGEVEKDWS